ncbi:MAG: lipoprotein signal peptidase [Bacteroidetes bacterium]|nr:lipoprotein signal peptidase [Bacteroidota bacterium]
MKYVLPIAVLLLCVAIDQWIKVYVKTHFQYGETRNLIGNWFKLYFIENNGMAFGLELGGTSGKYLLTAFRLAVSSFGAWYLWQNIRKNAPFGLLIAISLIMAGALGNIIDSIFYGKWFRHINDYTGGWFQGHVVDMFYAPMYEGHIPKWFPFWKNEMFTFFSPIWNFADACITVGVAIMIVGQNRFFPSRKNTAPEAENAAELPAEETAPDAPAESSPESAH